MAIFFYSGLARGRPDAAQSSLSLNAPLPAPHPQNRAMSSALCTIRDLEARHDRRRNEKEQAFRARAGCAESRRLQFQMRFAAIWIALAALLIDRAASSSAERRARDPPVHSALCGVPDLRDDGTDDRHHGPGDRSVSARRSSRFRAPSFSAFPGGTTTGCGWRSALPCSPRSPSERRQRLSCRRAQAQRADCDALDRARS